MERTRHELKSETRYYSQIQEGVKTCELVENNYSYKLHDIIVLQEYDPENGYTGRQAEYVITYILTDWETSGLAANYVVMCFVPLTQFLDWVTSA